MEQLNDFVALSTVAFGDKRSCLFLLTRKIKDREFELQLTTNDCHGKNHAYLSLGTSNRRNSRVFSVSVTSVHFAGIHYCRGLSKNRHFHI